MGARIKLIMVCSVQMLVNVVLCMFVNSAYSVGSTVSPTASPTSSPTTEPTSEPTVSPTGSPTASPTASPTSSPTAETTNTTNTTEEKENVDGAMALECKRVIMATGFVW